MFYRILVNDTARFFYFLVLYENGYDNISIYDGGWYEWLMHDDFPVQVGDPSSDDCQHTTVGDLPTGKAAKE